MKQLLGLFCCLLFLNACNNANTRDAAGESNDLPTIDSTEIQQAKAPEAKQEDASPKPNSYEQDDLNAFVPSGFSLLDFEYGDLNRDELKNDAILVLQPETGDTLDAMRPVLILVQQEDGSLQQVARNNGVVLCQGCGGVLGDPYQDIAIKNGYFSLEHFGGSRYKWNLIITFKYDPNKDTWVLHKYGEESYDGFNPDSVETNIRTPKEFGTILFEDYSGVD
jgi:hypothetical protein